MTTQSWAARRRSLLPTMTGDLQVRNARPDDLVTAAIANPDLSLAETIQTVMTAYADRPALGVRATETVTDASGARVRGLLPAFDTITYGELWNTAGRVAAAWQQRRNPVRAGDFVCLAGFTGSDLVIAEVAAVRLGAVTVPLQAGAPPQQWMPILAETRPVVLATSVELLAGAVEAVLAGHVPQQLALLDYHPDDDVQRSMVAAARERLRDTDCEVVPLHEIAELGRDLAPPPVPVPGIGPDSLAQLLYTSGSTGTPKGAMYTDRLLALEWRSPMILYAADPEPFPVITLNYLPLSHIAGRSYLITALSRGGTAYFTARSDMSTLAQDFALARPTMVVFVPRICDMFFQLFHGELARLVAAGTDPDTAAEQIRTHIRERVLGGRLHFAVCGSAPLSNDMAVFMESILQAPLSDGYGSTEAGGVMIDGRFKRPEVLGYKLIDVPELGFHGTDQPYPRGELLIKTAAMFTGYFRRPGLDSVAFDADGYFRTGDIVAELGPDHVRYVDRRNDVLKLSQGEFVPVAQLEVLYSTSPLIAQIYIYGSSERSYVLAVVVPSAEAAAAHPTDLKDALRHAVQAIAREAGRSGYEIPRDILIESEPFTRANGLLSGVGKLARPVARQKYAERLEQCYTDNEQQQSGTLAELRRAGATQPPLDTVRAAVSALLGIDGAEVGPDTRFGDLGGDSLSALAVSDLLQEIYGVLVPVGAIVGPTTNLRGIAAAVERARAATDDRPTAASVHPHSDRIHSTELTLDKFIDARILAAAANAPNAPAPARTVLLTGANGYLGRFLCLAWLERMDAVDGEVVCVVRGRGAAEARARLDDVFDSGDSALLHRYRELSPRLRVIAGDIAEPHLGLPDPEWNRLAETIDAIVHAAASVNHVLPYDQLFDPNVAGTAAVVELALTGQLKPVTYLSTVAVTNQTAPANLVEDGDIRSTIPQRALSDGYADGYGSSKWAGEVLLREAHEAYKLPVTVFRSDMILAHSHYSGQLNVPDMFTRLVLSLLGTRLAPKSFYHLNSGGGRQRAHYTGLPVDFVAAAITAIGAAATTGHTSYDVHNPHDDGISLDQIVDWLIEAGEPIQRIDDYPEWLSKFEAALRGLPSRLAQASVLPLLDAYRSPAEPLRGAPTPAAGFRSAVQGLGSDIPHLSRELISKYLSDLDALRLREAVTAEARK
ncbi:carboxylic acid reductase [Nocardia tengchongensis]|uniref:carboxylic acid reductase n=1 Tax=Nocardia tengchongensis TaxID=2055889 RepID=UPI0036D107D7